VQASSIPDLLPPDADRIDLWERLSDARKVALEMAKYIEILTAWSKLYASENAMLRNMVHGKKAKPKDHFLATKARVLTKPEQLAEIKKKEEEVKKKAKASEEKAQGGGTGKRGRPKGKGKTTKQAKQIWVDDSENDDYPNGGHAEGTGRDDESYEPSSSRHQPAPIVAKPRPQRTKRGVLKEVQQNIEPLGLRNGDGLQEPETRINTAATSRRTTRQQKLTGNQEVDQNETPNIRSNETHTPASDEGQTGEATESGAVESELSKSIISTSRTCRGIKKRVVSSPSAPVESEDDFFIRNPAARSSARLRAAPPDNK
jgi:hypothetical protein